MQLILHYQQQIAFKKFGNRWTKCNSSIIIHIRFVQINAFQNWDDNSKAKGLRHIAVTQHSFKVGTCEAS